MDEVFDEEQRKIQKSLNQAKKREMAEKYGAHFSEESDLDPEIESQWLNNIEEYERQYENSRRVSVREFLGSPRFKSFEEIPPEKVDSEVKSLLELLDLHNIVVDCLAEVSSEDLYRFVTTELMEHEIDDIRIEGMKCHFIYEEFHPNDKADAKQCVEEFLWSLFGRHTDFLKHNVANEELCDSSGRRITREEMWNLIRAFHERYALFTDHAVDCVECTLEGNYASVRMKGEWSGLKSGSMESVTYKGDFDFRLKKSPYGGYEILRSMFPGFNSK
jgi:hypothetical protein